MSKCPHCGFELTTGGCINPSCQLYTSGNYFIANEPDQSEILADIEKLLGHCSCSCLRYIRKLFEDKYGVK